MLELNRIHCGDNCDLLGTDKALAINLPVRSSTGAACGAARGDFCGKSTRASIGLRRVGSHDFQPSRNP